MDIKEYIYMYTYVIILYPRIEKLDKVRNLGLFEQNRISRIFQKVKTSYKNCDTDIQNINNKNNSSTLIKSHL